MDATAAFDDTVFDPETLDPETSDPVTFNLDGVECRFEWSQDPDIRIARVSGDVDMSNAHHLVDALLQIGNRSLVVDLTGVSFMDSTGLRALFDLEERLSPRTLTLHIDKDGRVERLLEITGLIDHFAITTPS